MFAAQLRVKKALNALIWEMKSLTLMNLWFRILLEKFGSNILLVYPVTKVLYMLGSGGGSVGRLVASNTCDPWFNA